MRRRTAVAVALATAAAGVWRDGASAHGRVGGADLPIPSWLFGWGASIVLIVSFVALATLWPQPRLEQAEERPWFRIPAWVDPICGLIGVALFGIVVYSGLEGTSEATNNFASNFIFVEFWVGLVIVSVLFGDVFRAFNPWLAVGTAARRVGLSSPIRRPYPVW